MLKDKPPSPPDDHYLWDAYKEKVKPLGSEKESPETTDRIPPTVHHQQSVSAKKLKPSRPSLSDLSASPRSRRLKNITIQAEIDLHGMTQKQAYEALLNFISRCYHQEKRVLLVITGKGKFRSSENESVGILRQEVPRWLNQPPLRPMIIEYAEATQKHGGAGALYVFLRKQRV